MYSVHDWAELKHPCEREGVSKKAAAEKLGMSRTTVHRLLSLPEPPVYERAKRSSLLDPHREAILAMLREDATVRATVIRERLQAQGYGGGITILKDFVADVRPQFLAARAYQRTSYLPGEIAQVDWWHLPVRLSLREGIEAKVYALVVTLPHSAAHAAFFTYRKTLHDFLPALLGCLSRLGGVPSRLVLDNDSSMVVRVPGHRSRLHPEAAALFGALRTKPVILAPRRPTSKGSVERTVGYLETSFLPLRTFGSLEDLQAQHDAWAKEIAYRRSPRRLGARVADAYLVEKGYLAPLPGPLPQTDQQMRPGSRKTPLSGWPAPTIRCLPASSGVGCRSGSRSPRSSSISKAKRSRVTCAATFPPMWSSTPITPGPSLSPERPASACAVETWPWRFLTLPAMTFFLE